MYYIIAESEIVDQTYRRPEESELKQWANDMDCEVWVIDGEYAGISVYPDEPDEEE